MKMFVPVYICMALISGSMVTAPRKSVFHETTRYISSGHARIAIIGAGAVGATTAYCIMMRHIASEVILFDACKERCLGEVYDLSDAIPVSSTAHVRFGEINDAGLADIIIITAGARRKQGQSRFDLIKVNQKIIETIINQISPINPKAVLVIVSNPVDIMTLWAQKFAGLPLNQVFGSGTYLDTQRLRGCIADKLGISQQSIDAYILGEHGDSQFAVWSSAQIAGVPLKSFTGMSMQQLDCISQAAKQKGQDIIMLKEATFYGIASCVADLCESIVFNQKRVFPVSGYNEKFGLCLSMPAVIGENGIERILSVPLDEQEKAKLEHSVSKLNEVLLECGIHRAL